MGCPPDDTNLVVHDRNGPLSWHLQPRLTSSRDTPNSCQSSPAIPVNLRYISTVVMVVFRRRLLRTLDEPLSDGEIQAWQGHSPAYDGVAELLVFGLIAVRAAAGW